MKKKGQKSPLVVARSSFLSYVLFLSLSFFHSWRIHVVLITTV